MLNKIYNNQEKLMGTAYVFVVFTSIIKLSSAISSSSIGVIIGELFAMTIYIAIAIMWFLLIKIGNSIRKRKVDIEKQLCDITEQLEVSRMIFDTNVEIINELTEKIDEKEQVIKKNDEIINQLLKKIDELKNTH